MVSMDVRRRQRLGGWRARDLLVVASVSLTVAAVLPWHRLIHLVRRPSGGALALAAGAGVCALLAALVHRVQRSEAAPLREPRHLQPISWWWLLAATAAVGVTVYSTTAWMLAEADQVRPGSERARARIDAVRTGLATGGGMAAAGALMLAFRRQHHSEVTASSADYDATEKRITELYTKAVEQLGSDKAACGSAACTRWSASLRTMPTIGKSLLTSSALTCACPTLRQQSRTTTGQEVARSSRYYIRRSWFDLARRGLLD
jgi:hypothetical protein